MEYREEIIPQYTSSADARVASLHKILEYRSNFSGKSTAIYRLLSDIFRTSYLFVKGLANSRRNYVDLPGQSMTRRVSDSTWMGYS